MSKNILEMKSKLERRANKRKELKTEGRKLKNALKRENKFFKFLRK